MTILPAAPVQGHPAPIRDFDLADEEIRARGRAGERLLGIKPREFNWLYRWSRAHAPAFVAGATGLRRFLFFVGYPRSGHSLVGALLDAHPDLAVAHELDVLDFMARGFSREQILFLCRENARLYGRAGRLWGEFDYSVPGGWQGSERRLVALGDKKGGATSAAFAKHPYLLGVLLHRMELRPRAIHAVRDPWDNIATIARKNPGTDGDPLDRAIRFYVRLARTNEWIVRRLGPRHAITLAHEDFVARPAEQLAALAAFLGVAPEPDWIAACLATVRPEPNRTGRDAPWTAEQTARVAALIEEIPFLHRYRR